MYMYRIIVIFGFVVINKNGIAKEWVDAFRCVAVCACVRVRVYTCIILEFLLQKFEIKKKFN